MRVVGMQSGTSMDGVDAVVLDLEPDGPGLTARTVHERQVPYPPELRAMLGAAVDEGTLDPLRLTMLDTGIGATFAAVAGELADRYAPVDLVTSLGQTLYHWVQDGTARGTVQLGQPAWIAERTGLPVVSDLRSTDIAAGGHGAPLAPMLDELLMNGLSATGTGALVNLGGIANITVVAPGRTTVGYDIGPANALLDAAWARYNPGADTPYDTDAAVAATGTVHEPTLRALLADPYYRREPPKSTGKEHFNAALLDTDLPLPDLLRTLTRLTATLVAGAVRAHGAETVLLSGGGAVNPLLRKEITELAAPAEVRTTDDIGVSGAMKEAVLVAVLGWLTWHGLPANLPAVTGAAGPRVLGRISPGRGPLRLPEPRGAPPAWLRMHTAPHDPKDPAKDSP